MLTVTLAIVALLAAAAIVWYGLRRMRAIQQVAGQMSGPVEEMREQLLLTADSAVDRLDGKMAQMEILLAELDRRSNLLAQQSQRQQALQNQLEQQQQQLDEWFAQQRRVLEQEASLVRRQAESHKAMLQQMIPVIQPASQPTPPPAPQPASLPPTVPPRGAISFQPQPTSQPAESVKSLTSPQRGQTTIAPASAVARGAVDKRALMLELAEQGLPAEAIAKKLGVGKGEVMLLLKLRKKTVHE